MIIPHPPELLQPKQDLDENDLKVLRAYQRDASLSFKDIGEITHLPASTVFDRIKRLRKMGVIRNIVPLLDASKLGLNTTAYIQIKAAKKEGDCCDLAEELAKIPEILEVHEIAGTYDILVKVKVRDNIDLHNVAQKIMDVPAAAEAHSTVVMRTLKEEVRLKV